MIIVETLHHVSINVTDLERARHFYSVVLGLPEIARPPFDFGGIWYGLGDRQLHLIVHPPTRTLRGTSLIDGRDGHFALRIADFDTVLAHLRSRQIPLVERRENATPWAQIYVTDPDGNVIELNAEREPSDAGAGQR
jgi:catechol 2,3-dioxygenase-like lactoylglutathione lyase family enzyme